MSKLTVGFVLGKFMPLHKGHELLLSFAANYVDRLYVVVDKIANATFSEEMRVKWVEQTIPSCICLQLDKYNPQDPWETAEFWNIWQDSLLTLLPEKVDYVFASENYGFKLAEILSAEFIPFDIGRQTVAINGTSIRENLYENWEFLSVAVKKDLAIRVCIIGPESSGKSTLTAQLAKHYNTCFVPEYARFLIESKGAVNEQDMLTIAKGQIALEEALASQANRILFCDTDLLATTIWSSWLFGKCADEITAIAKQKEYDLYLLTYPDLPWEKDAVRFFPNDGLKFFADCNAALERFEKKYSVIKGLSANRLNSAIKIIDSESRNWFQTY